MKKHKHEQEAFHIKADDILPLSATSTPEAEMLKRILQQMAENERMRIRNEFLRTILTLAIVLLILSAGAGWLLHDVLSKTMPRRSDYEKPAHETTALSASSPVIEQAHIITDAIPVSIKRPEPEEIISTKAKDEPKQVEPEPEEIYGSTLVLPIRGNIPLRAPIPIP